MYSRFVGPAPGPGSTHMIREGESAPPFAGTTDDGKRVSLAEFLGRGPLVLYFYPADFTPG